MITQSLIAKVSQELDLKFTRVSHREILIMMYKKDVEAVLRLLKAELPQKAIHAVCLKEELDSEKGMWAFLVN